MLNRFYSSDDHFAVMGKSQNIRLFFIASERDSLLFESEQCNSWLGAFFIQAQGMYTCPDTAAHTTGKYSRILLVKLYLIALRYTTPTAVVDEAESTDHEYSVQNNTNSSTDDRSATITSLKTV
ncbi:hypothetical protein T09_13128 [Trichinella sp. T9]|nr:hypothetical protein T09_13128 [Trichinella sp. T9]